MSNKIGIKGIEAKNFAAGVGYVIIPENIDTDIYKEDVYRTGKITIYGGYGSGNFNNIPIDREVLQRIEFPKKKGEFGTPVVWINLPLHNEPIIIACLKYDNQFYSLSEFRVRFTRGDDDNFMDFDLDGKKSKASLNVFSNNAKKASYEINIKDKNNQGAYKLIVDGKITNITTGENVSISQEKIVHAVADENGIVVANLILDPKSNKPLSYQDKYKNSLEFEEEKFKVKTKEIEFGEKEIQPVALAEALSKFLEDYDSAIAKMTFPTAFGPTGTRINQAEFTTLFKRIKEFHSKLLKTE